MSLDIEDSLVHKIDNLFESMMLLINTAPMLILALFRIFYVNIWHKTCKARSYLFPSNTERSRCWLKASDSPWAPSERLSAWSLVKLIPFFPGRIYVQEEYINYWQVFILPSPQAWFNMYADSGMSSSKADTYTPFMSFYNSQSRGCRILARLLEFQSVHDLLAYLAGKLLKQFCRLAESWWVCRKAWYLVLENFVYPIQAEV